LAFVIVLPSHIAKFETGQSVVDRSSAQEDLLVTHAAPSIFEPTSIQGNQRATPPCQEQAPLPVALDRQPSAQIAPVR
jgi:hypothetical protein